MSVELARVPQILSGAGARHQIGAKALELVPKGAAVLLVADPGLEASGAHTDLKASLEAAGLKAHIFKDFTGDPTIAQTDAAADLARKVQAQLVVALGGGSALDLGKVVAAIAAAPDSALKYQLCEAPFPGSRLKCITLPTTSGTGAEVTRTAILTRADKAKVWLWGEETKADLAILDPELTLKLPAFLTAATGIDALVHAVEAATNRNNHALNNIYAYEAIRLVGLHLLNAVNDPGNVAARAGVQLAATLAGIAIDNCGTAIAHNIGHAIGSLKGVHHGRAVGVAMLATLPWNIVQDDGRWAACAKALGAGETAADFARGFEQLIRASGLEMHLHECADISAERLAEQMMRPENVPMQTSNWRASSNADLITLARATLAMR